MSLFNSQTFTVKRYAPATIVNGVFQPVTPNAFSVSGTVHPATAEQLSLLPEGRRVGGTMVLFTATALQTGEESGNNADVVVINNKDYEVVFVKQWNNGIMNNYETLCQLVDAHL